jgi:hypothetical protein
MAAMDVLLMLAELRTVKDTAERRLLTRAVCVFITAAHSMREQHSARDSQITSSELHATSDSSTKPVISQHELQHQNKHTTPFFLRYEVRLQGWEAHEGWRGMAHHLVKVLASNFVGSLLNFTLNSLS